MATSFSAIKLRRDSSGSASSICIAAGKRAACPRPTFVRSLAELAVLSSRISRRKYSTGSALLNGNLGQTGEEGKGYIAHPRPLQFHHPVVQALCSSRTRYGTHCEQKSPWKKD